MLGPVLFSDVDGLRSYGECGPSPGGCGRNSLRFGGFVGSVFVLDIMGRRAAKASPQSLGVRCMSRAVRRLSRLRPRPTGVCGVCCAVAHCWVLRGGPPGQNSACLGSSQFTASPAAAGLTSILGASGEKRSSRGCRAVSSSAGGRCGICAVYARPCVVVALQVIGRGVQGTRVPRRAGRGGPNGVAPHVHGGVFPVLARGG